jgi:hypothetical protein
MIRNLIVSSTTAGVFGISCATLGAAAFGTAALPFIVGTTIGFVFGAYSHYRQCVIESATVLREMPDLFHYNIKHVYPASYRQSVFTNIINDNWLAKSMAVGALFNANDTLAEIRARQEAEFVDKYGRITEKVEE